MTLTNYWWLLIWLFAAGAVLTAVLPKQPVLIMGRREYRWSVPAALILVLPYIIWAGFRTDSFEDTGVYRATFFNAPSSLSQLPQYLNDAEKDKGFAALRVLMKSFIGDSDILFFLLIAAFQILCVTAIYRKYSGNFWFSFFLLVASTDYMSWAHNGIRQFLAVTAIFACTGLLLKKKYIPLLMVILLAATIHASALIMIPIVFIVQGKAWNRKTILFIIAIILAVVFIGRFTTILQDMLTDTQYNDMMKNEIWINDDGTNPIRVLIYSIPALLSFVGRKYIDEADDPVINLCTNMSIISAGLYVVSMVTSGIYIGRLPIYVSLYAYILLPWLIENMFEKRLSARVYGCTIVSFLGLFYYQMHMVWGII